VSPALTLFLCLPTYRFTRVCCRIDLNRSSRMEAVQIGHTSRRSHQNWNLPFLQSPQKLFSSTPINLFSFADWPTSNIQSRVTQHSIQGPPSIQQHLQCSSVDDVFHRHRLSNSSSQVLKSGTKPVNISTKGVNQDLRNRKFRLHPLALLLNQVHKSKSKRKRL